METSIAVMDEETKKIISNLCSSVDAMQAEIAALKNGAINSSTNPAVSQNSNVVYGNFPPNKNRKTAPEGSLTVKKTRGVTQVWTFAGMVETGDIN